VKFRDRYRGQAGAPLAISVTRRPGAESEHAVRERTLVSFSLTPAQRRARKQAKVWRGLATVPPKLKRAIL